MAFNKRETWTFEELLAETGPFFGLIKENHTITVRKNSQNLIIYIYLMTDGHFRYP